MKKIKYIIKYSSIVYNVYYYLFTALLKVIGTFEKTDDNLILFNSFGGRKYDDSPKAVFEEMLYDHRFDKFKLVWALANPEDYKLPDRALVVKDYTIRYFIYALKAKIWITNSSIEHGLCFKKKSTVYINTWHGSAIKYLGADVKEDGKSFKGRSNTQPDVFITQSKFDEYVFSRAYNIPITAVQRFGLPRNDELCINYNAEKIVSIKKALFIKDNKKIVLYAPTFREYSRGKANEITQEMRIDLEQWEKELGKECVLLVRAHYEVARLLNFNKYENVINVSDYQFLNDLLIISDVLVSDYSSVFFDYSLLHKPMICYAYDFDEYNRNRGMYFDIREKLPGPCVENNLELLKAIKYVFEYYSIECEKTIAFQKEFVTEYGHGARNVCEYLAKMLKL